MPHTPLTKPGHDAPGLLTDEHPAFPGEVVLDIRGAARRCQDRVDDLMGPSAPDDYTAGDLVTAWVHERIAAEDEWKPDRTDPQAGLFLRFLRSDPRFSEIADDLEWYWDWKR